MILSIFRQFLELICADADQIGLFLLTGKLSKKVRLLISTYPLFLVIFLFFTLIFIFVLKFSRTLPSLCFILSWIYALLTHNQFASKSAELRQIILFHDVVVWSLLSRLCNKLQKMRESGDLNQCYFEPSRRSGKYLRHHSILLGFKWIWDIQVAPMWFCQNSLCCHLFSMSSQKILHSFVFIYPSKTMQMTWYFSISDAFIFHLPMTSAISRGSCPFRPPFMFVWATGNWWKYSCNDTWLWWIRSDLSW